MKISRHQAAPVTSPGRFVYLRLCSYIITTMSSSNNFLKPGTDYIGVGVGALIFNDEGKFLMGLRGPLAKNERGTWEIPGGAVHFGETLEEALKREIKEEIDVEIEIIEMLHVADHIIPQEKQHWISPTFICKITAGTPKVMEPGKCDKLEWFSLEETDAIPISIVTQQDVKILKERQHKTS
jgi:8-oxo-dGTP diphosphatase